MAEDDAGNDETLKDLDKSDIRSGVYEGGFKTWECSLDLASLLLDRGPRKDIDELVRCDQIVEVSSASSHSNDLICILTKRQLGCGTALPTLVLFQHALQNDMSLAFTLQDYNDTVLRLVTLPNLLLTWAAYQPTPLIDVSQPHGDLEISPETLQAFQSSLAASNITLKFLSGSWSPDMAPLITQSAPDMGTVVLGAETIYSPASTAAFVSLLMELLRRVKMAKAMVAAKKIYFGVGGSVDGLKEACREQGAVAYEIENHGVPGLDGGVGRALVEIQMY